MTLYAIGDIQGCAEAFESLLDRLGFKPGADRLWLVGDLVNRGPRSLAVLRKAIELGDSVTCVLGNHDLHLLAVVAGGRKIGHNDTFQTVLTAPDSDEIVDWLRRRPLLHHDPAAQRVLVHAGIPPRWDVEQAQVHAREVEELLRGPGWRDLLRTMYGNEPAGFRADLDRQSRIRYTINALTRMRYCDARGDLNLDFSGPPGSQPAGLVPWFDAPGRLAADTHIVFGHWASLGLLLRPDISALDSGCVWGGELTALAIESGGTTTSVNCS